MGGSTGGKKHWIYGAFSASRDAFVEPRGNLINFEGKIKNKKTGTFNSDYPQI